jgi:hypothetical protein
MKKTKELPILIRWEDFLLWLIPTTAKFPKHTRYSFVQRIDGLALDILDGLIQARYTKNKQPLLQQVNLSLERLRVLIRLTQQLHYLSFQQYEYSLKKINEVGQMLGNWSKYHETSRFSI